MIPAVVIAFRNEPDLQGTCDSIRATMPEAKIVCMEDVHGEGCGIIRHRAINAAADMGADAVCIVDAHMRFRPGALRAMFACVEGQDNGIYGCQCHHNPDCTFTGFHGDNRPHRGEAQAWPKGGAVFELIGEPEGAGVNYVPMAAKWRNTTIGKVEEQTCLMGACYAMSIAWYRHIGEPLKLLHGWGCDEEYLSIATHLCGGFIENVPVEVAHRMRMNGVASPVNFWPRLMANRIQTAIMFPWPDKAREYMMTRLRQSERSDCLPWAIGYMHSRAEDVKVFREHMVSRGASAVDAKTGKTRAHMLLDRCRDVMNGSIELKSIGVQ